MSRLLVCDKCGEPIPNNTLLMDERTWIRATVEADPEDYTRPTGKDYHRGCARSVTLAEVWAREGLVAL